METKKATWEFAEEDPDVINLGIGQPHKPLLPLKLLREAAASQLSDSSTLDVRHLLQYSAGLGTRPFLEALAAFLTRQSGCSVSPESLLTTNGNSQAIQLVCETFCSPGDVVFIEEPTYFLVHDILRECHVQMVPVPQLDTGGFDMAALEESLKVHKPVLLYTIPVFNNPTGTTHSDTQRRDLVQLAIKYNFKIMADEVYQLLSWADKPPNNYAWYANQAGHPNTVFSLNTFSKILSPALRAGWLETGAENLEKFGARGVVASGGGLNPFVASLIQKAIETESLDRHLETVVSEYALRCKALVDGFNSATTKCKLEDPGGGYFLWLKLPDSIDAEELKKQAHAHGVLFHAGVVTSISRDSKFSSRLRLSCAFYSVADMAEGGRRLAQAVNQF